jgi:hypothetical protein
MIEIANDMNSWSYTSLCQTNKDWIVGHAIGLGWGAVHFPLAYPSKTLSAGVVFIKRYLIIHDPQPVLASVSNWRFVGFW